MDSADGWEGHKLKFCNITSLAVKEGYFTWTQPPACLLCGGSAKGTEIQNSEEAAG